MDHNGNPTTGLDHLCTSQLTHLDFVPFLPDKPLHDPYPTIIATFATFNPSNNIVFDPSHRYQNATSVVCRWHYRTRPEIYSPIFAIFDELPLQKGIATGGKVTKAADVKRVGSYTH
jgi:hypothetical protein